MNDSSLQDYRSDLSGLPEDDDNGDDEIQASSAYHQEINTLKIEKLSQRVTIITIIIPCIIIAVLAFAYIDMKERVVDVDETQGNQVAQMSKKLEDKLNALDVRIAKAAFELDEKLSLVDKKAQALENQLAKTASAKADIKAVETSLAKLEKRIKTNAGQDKSTLATVERINRELLAAIKENNVRFKSQADKLNEDMQLFKEEFDARLLELSAYEQQIAQLNKTTSLVDKRLKTLKQDMDRARTQDIEQLKTSLEKKIQELEAGAGKQAPAAATPPAPANAGAATGSGTTPEPEPRTTAPGPVVPQLDTGGTGASISEETLTQ